VIARSRSWLRHGLAFAAVIAIVTIVPQTAAGASPYRVGVITEAWAVNHPAVEGLKEGLRELGIVEGRDVVYDIHFTRGKPDAAAAAADTLVKARVDLVFTSGEAATLAAKKATQRIPVVFTLVGDPVSVGMVSTLAYPGGNLTGISSRTPELAPKRLEFLKTMVPGLRRVWYIYYAGDVTDFAALTNLHEPARLLGLELLPRAVNDAGQLGQALKEVRSDEALFAPSSDTLDIPVTLHEAALASRVPAIFQSAIWVSHGGLVSYGPDFRAQGVQAARLVAKILRGAKPQDLPVEGVEHIHLALNLKTAGQLGLPVARKLIFRANAVYR
jgi:putative ABC transport system substrate-binding protein